MKRPWILALLAALAGCAGDRPDPPNGASVTIPPSWRSDAKAFDDHGADWWESFHDPVLSSIVRRALANNVDVAIASVRVEEARAHYRLAQSARLPDVEGSLLGGRQADVSPFGTPQYQTVGQGEVLAVFDADFFGRLAKASAAARAALLATAAAQSSVRLAVASSAASGYLNLCAADAKLEILHDTLKAREESLRYARSRANSGYATTLELRQAESEYHAAAQLIPATELAITQLEDGLSVLLGDDPGPVARGDGFAHITPPLVNVGVPSQLLRRRPDIESAEQRLVAADHSLDSARAAFMPDVELTASGGYVASSIIANPIKIFQLGGSILAPIFDSGRLRATEDVAVAQRDEAAYAYRKAVLGAFREVDDGLAAASGLVQEESSIIAQQDALAGALSLARNRYRAGYTSYLEQIDAERSLLAVNLQVLQVHLDRLNNSVALFEATGGGWTAPIDVSTSR